ncbi:unnamed protein product, partial [Musa acuminata var. zebrina]
LHLPRPGSGSYLTACQSEGLKLWAWRKCTYFHLETTDQILPWLSMQQISV